MMRLVAGLFLLLLGSGGAFAQTVPPTGCTTTTCTGAVLPSGYLSVVGNQLQNSPGNDVRPACATFRGLPTDSMAPIRNAGDNCVEIGWRDAYVGLPTVIGPGGNITAGGHVWAVTLAGTITVDGTLDPVSSGVTQLANFVGTIWQNTGTGWYTEPATSTATTDAWVSQGSATPSWLVSIPAGCNSLSQIASCVTAAQTANLGVILTHLGNEVPAPGSACVGRQQNGLWYSSGGSSGNDDGCGDGHNWAYADFKANTVSLLKQFNGNSTVFGYEFHNEPLVSGTFTGTGTGSTGSFKVQSGGILDPSGNAWHGYGINILDDTMSSLDVATIQRLYPKLNMIRLAVGGDGCGWACAQSNASIETWAKTFTDKGIVVMIESHVPDQSTGTANNTVGEYNWYKTLATDLKANPFIWFATGNELNDPGVDGEHQTVYRAVRDAGNSTMVILMVHNGNDYTPQNMTTNPNDSCLTLNTSTNTVPSCAYYLGMTNVGWDHHAYNGDTTAYLGCPNPTTASACPGVNTQSNANAAIIQHRTNVQAWTQTADGTAPVGSLEVGYIDYGNVCGGPNGGGTLTNSFSCGSGQIVTAALNPLTTGDFAGTIWLAWYVPCCQSQTDLIDRNSSPLTYYDTYGTTVRDLIASNSQGPVTGSGNAPINWGGSGDTDIRAACSDVGAAVNAVNSGVVLFCPGPINNTGTTLLSGASKTIASTVTNNVMDLSLAASKPVTGLPASKIAYSVHVFPKNVSGGTPDTPLATMVSVWNAYFGSLVKNGTAPVLNLSTGCSCDGSNGNLADDQSFMGNWVAYANGLASGGPAFTGSQQPMGNNWRSWGNFSENPNGTLNSDGTLKGTVAGQSGGQAFYWSQLLYTATAPVVPAQTTWNGLDVSAGITLSGNSLTATTTAATSQSVRATTSKSSGKVCFAVTAGTITADWDVGLSNSAYVLTTGGGLGADTTGIGFDPNSLGGKQGIFFGNAVLSSGAATSANGETAMICADLDAHLLWATDSAMRTALGSGVWNSTTGCNPTVAACGVSFSGLTCPCFPTYNDFITGGVATLGTTAAAMPFALPSGFSAWDIPVVTGGKPIIIFGANDNLPMPANDDRPLELALTERVPR